MPGGMKGHGRKSDLSHQGLASATVQPRAWPGHLKILARSVILLSYLFGETETQRGWRAGQGHLANEVCGLTPHGPEGRVPHPDGPRPDRLCHRVRTTVDRHHPCYGIEEGGWGSGVSQVGVRSARRSDKSPYEAKKALLWKVPLIRHIWPPATMV